MIDLSYSYFTFNVQRIPDSFGLCIVAKSAHGHLFVIESDDDEAALAEMLIQLHAHQGVCLGHAA